MTPTLIVLALLALAVGIVIWSTRKKTERPYDQRMDQDTAWNDRIGEKGEPPVASPFPQDTTTSDIAPTPTPSPSTTDPRP